MNMLSKIRSLQDSMSPALARIARSVIAHPDETIFQTVTELAEVSKSSEASVIRFSRDLGYNSFADFKMALALGQRQKQEAEAPHNGRIGQITGQAISSLKETEQLLQEEILKTAAQALLKADFISVMGVGASAAIAHYAAYRMTRLGKKARVFSDGHSAAMGCATMGKNDLLVCISSSGSTLDVIQAAKIARKKDAYLLSISNRDRTPLGKLVSLQLLTASPESPLTAGEFQSKAPQMLVLDLLSSYMQELAPELAEVARETAQVTSP
ncbi:MurR/RpiR family transcriptional regulator [Dongshaea marina]|uniref:MurR/RpiR family transcriptional regulator n=1 Tax=Dongshaea marina TaxID=2047966 RepID=UPI000D3E8182|nr:MurR/RpiR family transcriptional regulator [Dongshaea marina]